MKIIKSTIFLVTMSLAIPLYPIRLDTANGLAATAAIGAGVGMAALTYHLTKTNENNSNNLPPSSVQKKTKLQKFLVPFWGIVSAAVTGFFARWILYGYTPEYKMDFARNYKQALDQNPAAKQAFAQPQETLDTVQKHYIRSELWLVSAFRDMEDLIVKAQCADKLATQARQEASDDKKLVEESNKISKDTTAAVANLTAAMQIIRNDNRYNEQLRLQKRDEAEKERQRERERMAYYTCPYTWPPHHHCNNFHCRNPWRCWWNPHFKVHIH